MVDVLGRFIGGIHVRSVRAAGEAFQEMLRDPAGVQEERRREIVRANQSTSYGQKNGFAGARDLASFQASVPVADYGTMRPWIDRIAAGEPNVLSYGRVLMMERTSGTSGPDKRIPYTAALRAEFEAATRPWMDDLYRTHPDLVGLRSYWSISPPTRAVERTAGGVRIGFDDDLDYFGPATRWAIRGRLVRPDVRGARWRDATARALADASDLGLVSVWSPTFLLGLLERLDEQGHADPAALWPRLRVVSCWTEGASAAFLAPLARLLPHARIQGKGLLATEGVVSIPWGTGEGQVLAIGSHFLEFIDLDAHERPIVLAHELRTGRRYSPLLTTGGGLYRYHLKDVVRCVGHEGQTPRIAFEAKLDQVGDLVGEKVDAPLAQAAVTHALDLLTTRPAFAMLAPTLGPPAHYALYLEGADEGEARAASRIVEERLLTAYQYQVARELGQLAAVEPRRVKHGWSSYERELNRRGTVVGAIKPSYFDHRPIWDQAFGGGA